MIRVVIDTNVLVSSLVAPARNEAQVIAAVTGRRIKACMTAELLREYRGTLARPKFGFAKDRLDILTAFLLSEAEILVAPASGVQSPDPKDTMVIDCAIAAQADYLVTGNRRHFPEPRYGTAEVVNARELLDRLSLPR